MGLIKKILGAYESGKKANLVGRKLNGYLIIGKKHREIRKMNFDSDEMKTDFLIEKIAPLLEEWNNLIDKRKNYSWYEKIFYEHGSKGMGIYLKNPRHPLNEEFYLAGGGEI